MNSQQQFDATLEALISKIRASAERQFKYNEDTNVPAGRVAAEDSAMHAVKQGIASGINNFFEWCCEPAIETAHAILEDCNCHTEVRALAEFMSK